MGGRGEFTPVWFAAWWVQWTAQQVSSNSVQEEATSSKLDPMPMRVRAGRVCGRVAMPVSHRIEQYHAVHIRTNPA